jgi:hypothetical protein
MSENNIDFERIRLEEEVKQLPFEDQQRYFHVLNHEREQRRLEKEERGELGLVNIPTSERFEILTKVKEDPELGKKVPQMVELEEENKKNSPPSNVITSSADAYFRAMEAKENQEES